MGRKLTRRRPEQGERLRKLRITAELSQYELAEIVGEPQSNIATWELSDKPPRSDVLPKLAKALGVSIAALIGVKGNAADARKGPVGKVRQTFEAVSRLPRRQQEKVVEFVSAFVSQYKSADETR